MQFYKSSARWMWMLGAVGLGVFLFGYWARVHHTSKTDTLPGWHTALIAPLQTIDQHSVSLQQWKGKVLVINFWATWCEPCQKEIPALIKVREQRKKDAIEVVGVAVDWQSDVLAFIQKTPVSYPLILAPNEAPDMMRLWGNKQGVLPFTVILNAQQTSYEVMVGSIDMADLNRRLDRLSK